MADLTREQIEAWRSLYYKAEDALTPKGIEQLPILCDMALRALERTPTEEQQKSDDALSAANDLIADLQGQAETLSFLMDDPVRARIIFTEATELETYGKRSDEDVPLSRMRSYIRERIMEEMDEEWDARTEALPSPLGACPRCGKSEQWRKDNGCSDSGCPASRPQSNGKE